MDSAPADQILFVFAHQDDEVAAASRIMYEVASGAEVFCACLTDGSGRGASSAVRDRETIAALTELGVAPERIFFLGSRIPIADGRLPESLEIALQNLERVTSSLRIARMYALAWEGGHQDHDASHLVAVAYAARRGILARCYELPLYRAFAIRRVFRVLAPAPPRETWSHRRLRLREAIRAALLVRHYASQRRSWLGLFPELFIKTVVLRREVLRPVDVTRLRSRPHDGALLYESRFGYPHERFIAVADAFIRLHLR